ncbi:MAG: hypothetical protein H6739_39070 [Alphaproteobacteria bacterium]|nr:hypothetical protein [Alphaproteobacteria bacterium]
MNLSALSALPAGVAEAQTLIQNLDTCFMLGFARLGQDQKDALVALGRTFTGTPLAGLLDAAVDAVTSGQVTAEPLLHLAVARASLNGASHDALRAQALDAVGRADAETPATSTSAHDDALKPALDGVRQWLLELALAGLLNLDNDALSPFLATLETIQGEPRLARLAALLTGILDEWMGSLPVASMEVVPTRRWVDLWCRAMLLTVDQRAAAEESTVSGKLTPFAVEPQHHDHLVQLVVWSVLEPAGAPAQVVRVVVSAWKVDAVAGDEAWHVFGHRKSDLLDAVGEGHGLMVTDMTLTSTGALRWTGTAKTAGAIDPFRTAALHLGDAALPTVAPQDRHPVQLALPVLLQDVKVADGEGGLCVQSGDATLPLALDRVSPLSGLDPKTLGKADALIGLLRFDGGRWSVQPLLGSTGGKKATLLGPALKGVAKGRSATLSTLQERAGKLLRKKS